MAALTSEGILPIVDQDISARTAALRDELGFAPWLGVVSDNLLHGPTDRYVDSLTTAAREAGVMVLRSWYTQVQSRPAVEEGIEVFNADPTIFGIAVTVPLRDEPEHTDEVLNKIDPEKAVDGQGQDSLFRPGVVLAIPKFLDEHRGEYGFDYREDEVVILGKGMVGGGVFEHMRETGAGDNVRAFDEHSDRLEVVEGINRARIIVSATGQRGIVKPNLFDNLDQERVLIDLGGEVSEALRKEAESHHATHITSTNNGVGRLTGRMVIANLLTAAETTVKATA